MYLNEVIFIIFSAITSPFYANEDHYGFPYSHNLAPFVCDNKHFAITDQFGISKMYVRYVCMYLKEIKVTLYFKVQFSLLTNH